jgi:hypothetical protein
MYINELEALWILSNLLGLMLTISTLVDARADEKAIKALNGRARELVGRGNVRRESLRVLVQVLLLAVVVPGMFRDQPTPLTLPIACLLAVPWVLVLNSALDVRERRQLADMLDVAIDLERLPRRRPER